MYNLSKLTVVHHFLLSEMIASALFFSRGLSGWSFGQLKCPGTQSTEAKLLSIASRPDTFRKVSSSGSFSKT